MRLDFQRLDFQTLEYIIDRLCPSQSPYVISNLEMPDTRVDQLLGQYHAPDYTQQFHRIVEELNLESIECPDLSELTVNLVNTDHSLIHSILYLTLDEYRQGLDYQSRADLCERTRQELMDQHIDETPHALAQFLKTNLMIVGVTGVELASGAKVDSTSTLETVPEDFDKLPLFEIEDLPTLLIYRNYMDVYLPVTHRKVESITTLKASPVLQWFWQKIPTPKPKSPPAPPAPSAHFPQPLSETGKPSEKPKRLFRRESVDEPDEIRRRELSKHKLDRLQELCELCDLPTTKPGKTGKPIRMTKAELIESLVHHS